MNKVLLMFLYIIGSVYSAALQNDVLLLQLFAYFFKQTLYFTMPLETVVC